MSSVFPTGPMLERMIALGLVTAEQGNACREQLGDAAADERSIAAALVRDGVLTAWQLEALRVGQPPLLLDDGRYLLLRELGHGGMGVVLLARHRRLNRAVAIKLLPRPLTVDSQHVARFRREMEAIGRLTDPHIVQAIDAGEFDGQQYLVMEYIDGGTLSDVLGATGPLSVADACEAIRQAALGLQHIADHRLVHRDIKPSNLMLGRDGVVKVSDLGLALLQEVSGSRGLDGAALTSTGQIMGTVDFMSPDQMLAPHDIDARADLYSLGCTLYALLAGSAPFSGPAYATIVQKIDAHRHSAPPNIQSVRPDIPEELAALLHRLLAKSPSDRPASPRQLSTELARFAEGCDLRRLAERAFAHGVRSSSAGTADSTFVPIASSLTGTIPPATSADFAGPATPTVLRPPGGSASADRSSLTPKILLLAEEGGARSRPPFPRRFSPFWASTTFIVTATALVLSGIYWPGRRVLTGEFQLDLNVPADRATVSIDGESISTSDLSRFLKRPVGPHQLVVEAPGFARLASTFEVKSGGRDRVSAHLSPTASELNVAASAAAPTLFDPALIAASRLAAPNTSALAPFAEEDFGMSRRMLRKSSNDLSFRHESDRYAMTVRSTWNYNAPCPGGPQSAPAFKVVGRIATGQGGWFIDLYRKFGSPERSLAIRVSIEAGPQLRVSRAYWQSEKDRGPEAGPFRHPAIRPVDQWNELFVIARDGQLELYVNGLCVAPPVQMDPEQLPAEVAVGVQATDRQAETAEFLSYRSWDARRLSAALQHASPQPARPPSGPLGPAKTSDPLELLKAMPIQTAAFDVLPKLDRIPSAADLSNVKPLFVEEMVGPDTVFLSMSRSPNTGLTFRDGRLIVSTEAEGSFVGIYPWSLNEFTVEATACNRGQGIVPNVLRNSWSLVVEMSRNVGPKVEFEVSLYRSGQWRIQPSGRSGMKWICPYSGFQSHPAIRPGSAENTLRVTCRNRRIALHVNGVAVCHPFELAFDPGEMRVGLAVHSDLPAETEFERITVWPAAVDSSNRSPSLSGRRFDPTPERAAAIWVLSRGGSVELLEGNERRSIRKSADLPIKPFRLTAIDLTHNATVTDQDLKRFNGLSTLEWLNLDSCRVTGTGFRDVSGLDSLDWLLLHDNPVTDDGLAELVKFRTVTHLGLTGSRVTNEGLQFLSAMPSLRALGLARTSITDGAIHHIAEIPSLVELYLEFTAVSGSTLDSLSACPLLEKLHLYSTQLSAQNAGRLAGLSSLRMLAVDRTLLDRKALMPIGRLKQLEFLGLGRLPVEDADLASLKECRELRELFLWQTRLTDAGIPHLLEFPHLWRVVLNEAKLTEAGLLRMSELPTLRELEVRATSLPNATWTRFQQRRPNVRLIR